MYATHVSFNAQFIFEHTASSPAGRDVLDALAPLLQTHCIEIKSYSSTEYSHSMDLLFEGKSICLELGLVDDENAQWLLYFRIKYPCFGLREYIHRNVLSRFAEKIDEALKNLSDVNKIRWYRNQHVWNYKPEQYWISPHA